MPDRSKRSSKQKFEEKNMLTLLEQNNIKLKNQDKELTFALNSSVESQEPIFNNAVKAGAAAEPNSREEANKGSNCRRTKE